MTSSYLRSISREQKRKQMDALNDEMMDNFVFRANESSACTQFGVKPKCINDSMCAKNDLSWFQAYFYVSRTINN